MSTSLRSKGEIVLNAASNRIASLLLSGGGATHLYFTIPLVIDEDLIYNIKQGSASAKLLVKVKLIIWDKASMINKYYFETLNRKMRDILRFSNLTSFKKPFGGKVVNFFRRF